MFHAIRIIAVVVAVSVMTVSPVHAFWGDIPTADQAFQDFQSERSFVAFREACKVVGLLPVKYNYSYRIPYILNLGYMTGMEALCVQFVVKYQATYTTKESGDFQVNDSTVHIEYDREVGTLVIRKTSWVYYLKSIDGWLYCGAESFFTSNFWDNFFSLEGPGRGIKEKPLPPFEWKSANPE
jgi:hypothetical protein